MFYQFMAASTLFYTAHWQTYVSGTLLFGKFDVTEAQITIIIMHIVSAIFGVSVWSLQVCLPSLTPFWPLVPNTSYHSGTKNLTIRVHLYQESYHCYCWLRLYKEKMSFWSEGQHTLSFVQLFNQLSHSSFISFILHFIYSFSASLVSLSLLMFIIFPLFFQFSFCMKNLQNPWNTLSWNPEI